jgi:phosphoadenosine phosphosulfate reductase
VSGAATRVAAETTVTDYAAVNRALDAASAEDILRWAVGHFAPGKLGLVSAFGPGSSVLIQMLVEIEPDIPIVFVDILHHFPETLQHMETLRDRFNLNLRIFRPAADREQFENKYGPRLWERDLALYQQVAKVAPFLEATRGFDAWITGRRRDQSSTRANLQPVEGEGKLKINPLARWTRGEIWRYILDNDLPYNPLHDQGYTSIGDEPLTTPVGSEEDERAGRWRGQGITECGIHLV